jgi:hypothetical protein
MPNQPRLKVIKVPLDYVPDFKSVNFPPMPRLYLEFFENKTKVKPELRNKEYIPKLTNYTPINTPSLQDAEDYARKQNDTLTSNIETEEQSRSLYNKTTPRSSREKSIIEESSKDSKKNSREDGSNKKLQILDISKMSDNDIQQLANKKKVEKREVFFRYKKNNSIDKALEVEEEKQINEISDDDIGYKSYNKNEEHIKSSSNTEEVEDNTNDNYYKELNFKKETNSPVSVGNIEEENTDKNLLNILKGNKVIPPSSNSQNLHSEQATINNIKPNIIQSQPSIPNLPPSISEINSGKVINTQYRDLTNAVVNEDDIIRKRKILSDFKRIKKLDKDANIPEFNELTDLNTLEREYSNVVKNLHIDSNVENYKKWLTMGFIGLEWVLSNLMKFEEIKGFSAAQMTSMNQYERILVEIGEKSYVPEEKRLAPEIRLIGIILMNAATFVGMKMLFKSTGMGSMNLGGDSSSSSTAGGGFGGLGGLGNLFSSMGGATNTTNTNKPKKKMPGPDINLDDLNFKKNE